ncbi:MAG: hypothetical protein PW790_09005 [Parvibaculaceae bacterium]|nr:hypothetical protein [Parvibaculaceae bacterium]
MLGFVVRILLLGAGIIAGWLIPRDDAGFAVVEFVIVLVFFALASVAILYVPKLWARWKERK